jgi:hypothetical protein
VVKLAILVKIRNVLLSAMTREKPDKGMYGGGGQSQNRGQCVAIGDGAGRDDQEHMAVAIGNSAGFQNQRFRALAVGTGAGRSGQGQEAVALGTYAGYATQSDGAVAIGTDAGRHSQGANSIAIGSQCAKGEQVPQGTNAIAIGTHAGWTGQNTQSIVIGSAATTPGSGSGIGASSIAIGYSCGVNLVPNSIAINASGSPLSNTLGPGGLFITPIRDSAGGETQALCYNTTTKEVTYGTSGTKTFVINHPDDKSKYLVHACLEGPEAAVYYRGRGEILENEINIKLPKYVENLIKKNSETIHVTPIYNGKINRYLSVSNYDKNENSFSVYGEPGEFNWVFYATRETINVEPYKKNTKVKGDGPYTWI